MNSENSTKTSVPAAQPQKPATGKTYLFTSESVSEGHPDKVADQISDAILDQFLAEDPNSRVACETLVTLGQTIIAGEAASKAYVDLDRVARRTIRNIGYTKPDCGFSAGSCGVLTALHEQSVDIARGVSRKELKKQGAGDQGMMFGYATDETPLYIPLPLALSHAFVKELAYMRKVNRGFSHQVTRPHPAHPEDGWLTEELSYLGPDAKSQVTVEYDENNRPVRVHTVVISTMHEEFIVPAPVMIDSKGSHSVGNGPKTEQEADQMMLDAIRKDVKEKLLPRVIEKLPAEIQKLFDDDLILLVNPTGKFVIGGPAGDTGLTGRKIIVDTYGGRAPHGGGAFSGKDPSKVDRSAAYAARHIAKNLVAAGVAHEAVVQVAYAIGVAEPVSLMVDTRGTALVPLTDAEISEKVSKLFDMTPYGIEQRLKLRNPIYSETASYGHVGRTPRVVEKRFITADGDTLRRKVELFTWEKLDYVDKIRKAFSLK